MDLAKQIRLNRIFSHPSGRLCSVAIDHFIGYQKGLPKGLVNVPKALRQLMGGKPDAVTLLKGMAKSAWPPYAGSVPMIIQSVTFTADERVIENAANPEEVLRLGADAIAVSLGVFGPNEGKFLSLLTKMVEGADRIGLPVIAHIYPRDFSKGAAVVHDPDSIMWAVRCGIESGADVIKVPFTGDAKSFKDIIATSPVPIVAAGGPKCDDLESALELMVKIVDSGARGATIGRNVWGSPDPTRSLIALRGVIHDCMKPDAALKAAGLKSKSL